MRKWRANNPKKSVFYTIKDRAKERKIDFTLTLAEFLQFCDDTGYLSVKGMHVDRIDATEGYHLWNIQALIGSENIAKGNRERHSPRYQEYLRKKREKELQENGVTEEDCPF